MSTQYFVSSTVKYCGSTVTTVDYLLLPRHCLRAHRTYLAGNELAPTPPPGREHGRAEGHRSPNQLSLPWNDGEYGIRLQRCTVPVSAWQGCVSHPLSYYSYYSYYANSNIVLVYHSVLQSVKKLQPPDGGMTFLPTCSTLYI